MAYPSCLQSPPLRTDRLPSGRRQLVRDLIVCVDEQTWTIPQGTDTDYSSIPAIGRFVVRWSRVDIAGVIRQLERAGYQGWYVLEQDKVLDADPAEGEGPLGDAVASVEYLRKLAVEL